MEGRFGLKTGAAFTLAALIACTSAATVSVAADVAPVVPPTSSTLDDGRYIVMLDEDPAATYTGGEAGLVATKPAQGQDLDATSDAVTEYTSYLTDRQDAVAAEAGVTADANLTVTLNAFTANLTAAQAAKLAGADGVAAVVLDEIYHLTAVPSTEFLGLSGPGGVWEGVGGPTSAGEGVVVGVIDTGIAPENPSFAGDPLGTTPGDAPYLEGNTVVFNKADGAQFRSDRVAGAEWNNSYYSTKLIGAKYFSAGAEATGYDFTYDYISPRDGDGHGSHTASTAAGNHEVPATIGDGIDMGTISGVAPGAKIAAYKACFVGPDLAGTDDDICAGSDLLAAVDAATKDGVDVINFSIGGGAATTTFDTLDIAFFNAAAAGVFVSVSAGNSGPDASTADHASPWYTTVAASSIPTYEGTASLSTGFEAAGAGVSVPTGVTVTAPVVYSGDIPAAGVDAADAAQCLPDSLDAALAADNIVVCDRGNNARFEKSQVVQAAGGIGMILVNVVEGSLDNDLHSVPTVHISHTFRDALLEGVRAGGTTATLVSGNTTGIETAVPVVAGFSSRGPMLADGSDILKPDVTAPGVNILAAVHNAEGAAPAFDLKSGTSMSSPHVAGLGAIYLGERPNATPAEVKSALMTTAYDAVDEAGDPDHDPFAQGAGHVDPTKFFNAGLVYLNGPDDWKAFIEGKGYAEFDDIEPIDGSDLNIASIAIGSLAGPQTVTRTVTAQTAGTYSASVELPGINVSVEPSTITLAAGESATFTVSFENESAPVEQYTTGFLTWASDSISVRSPLAIYPTTVDAPAELAGFGVDGTVDYSFVSGVDGDIDLALSGLTPYEIQVDPNNPVEGHSGDENSGDDAGDVLFLTTIEEATKIARFDLDSSDDAGSDLDLSVYHVVSPEDLRYYATWSSATGSADEQVTLENPDAGTYLVVVNVYSTTGPMVWDLATAYVTGEEDGAFSATPNPVAALQGEASNIQLGWQGLALDTRYLGHVGYGESDLGTILTVDTGSAAPVATVAPTLAGSGDVGEALTVNPGEWDVAGVTFAYEWLKDGEPIPAGDSGLNAVAAEATDATTYTPVEGDIGAVISVRVFATEADNPNVGEAVTNEITVTAAAVTPEPTPEPTVAPTVDPTESATPTPTNGAGGGEGALPITGGADAMAPLLIGFLIVALGGAAFVIGRRRAHAE